MEEELSAPLSRPHRQKKAIPIYNQTIGDEPRFEARVQSALLIDHFRGRTEEITEAASCGCISRVSISVYNNATERNATESRISMTSWNSPRRASSCVRQHRRMFPWQIAEEFSLVVDTHFEIDKESEILLTARRMESDARNKPSKTALVALAQNVKIIKMRES